MDLSDILQIGTTMTTKSVTKPVKESISLPENRDMLHHDLMTKVRLNRYDLKFMSNISVQYLTKDKPLSPGQNDLYEKIVHKYRKQLRKLSVNYRDVLALNWKNGIIALETLNQKTYLRLADNEGTPEIQLYFNFNKNQIEEVRAIVHDDAGVHLNGGVRESFGNGQKYNFNWNNTDKTWSGPFNLYLFKGVYDFANRIDVKLDDSVTELVSGIEAVGTEEEWTPGVRIVNGRLYVSHITETMLPILNDIDPCDLSIVNIERLTKLGLIAPPELADIAQYVNSVSPATKHNVMDAPDVNDIKNYIKESGRKVVLYTHSWIPTSPAKPLVAFEKLSEVEDWDLDVKRLDHTDFRDEAMVDKLLAEGYNTLISTTPITNLFHSQESIGKFALAADKVIYLSIAGKT